MVKALLARLAGVDETKDLTEIRSSFIDRVETRYFQFRGSIIPDVRDSFYGSRHASTTTKEDVKLDISNLAQAMGNYGDALL